MGCVEGVNVCFCVSQSCSGTQLKESMQKCRGSLSQSGEEELELTDFGCDVSLAVTVLEARGVVWEGQALAQIWSKLLSQTAVCC